MLSSVSLGRLKTRAVFLFCMLLWSSVSGTRDGTLLPIALDLLNTEAELSEHDVGIRASQRRRIPDHPWGPTETGSRSRLDDSLDIDEGAARACVWMRGGFGER
jgi:hypothetical protein